MLNSAACLGVSSMLLLLSTHLFTSDVLQTVLFQRHRFGCYCTYIQTHFGSLILEKCESQLGKLGT